MATDQSIAEERQILDNPGMDLLFREARSHKAWQARPVSDELLREIYDLAKWGPTSANTSPMRVVFVRTPEGREKLAPMMMAMNADQVLAAPVTAIIAYDTQFVEHLPKLMPHLDIRPMFTSNPALSEETAFRNSTLQGAYLMIAARAFGLDCGPMSGFYADKVNEEYFADGRWRVNFICTLGYGDAEKLFPRAPRLDFDEACVLA